MTEVQSFFARRRAGLKAEREAEQVEALPEIAEPVTEELDLSEMSDADILDLFDLPDPDTLRKGDNFAAFMAKAVPLHLRNRALRNLWRSDPVLACLDGLNDYDADYLTGSTGQGIIQTSYQVGKGLLAHVEKLAAEQQEPEPQDEAITLDDEETAIVASMIAEEVAVETEDAKDDASTEDAPAQPPRRMRFAFDGDRA